MGTPTLTRWPSSEVPTRESLGRLFRAEDLASSWWSNGPGDRYNTHSHTYHKVLYCARGSIRFLVHPGREANALAPGDRLDIPAGTLHSAVAGPEGVTCAEAARR